MNPETNRFEPLEVYETQAEQEIKIIQQQLEKNAEQLRLLRPDGTPVPAHWSVYQVGEVVVVKNYSFKVAYIGEQTLLLEPVGPVLVCKAEP